MSQATTPHGILVSVGGAEDKGTDLEKGIIQRNRLNFFELGILKTILSLIKKGEMPRVEVITTASSIPDEVSENYLDAFKKLGCDNVGHLRIRNREDAAKPEYIERLKQCNCIMLSGGNQLRLSSIFGGTEFLTLLKERYQKEHFVIGGTSAGAMAMSNTMIYEGSAAAAHLKGEVKITTGLGLMQDVIIDSHFDKRGRFNRLAQAVASNPGAIGIGLGEDTGVVVKHGTHLQAVGSGSVIIIDGKNIDYNNIADIEFGKPISVENIIVHIMSAGDVYSLASRTFEGRNIEAGIED
ncbi:MAG: cyanophycinase [Bacteroidetes bacterium]|nr:cyanophycinase [Bacteroidota bacterium]MBS1739166.1 cyanophycinase [Bacteroidota bacterium]MBS1775824.1 cyanophycinase [Bacteroidota bacterium]